MLFNSLIFAVFLPVVLGVYWLLHRSLRWQNRWLLAVSYLFYGWWDWRYFFLIAGCSAVNFAAGWIIGETDRRWLRRTMLTLCCVVCLGVLGLFKYYNFFVDSFAALFASVGIEWHPLVLNLMLPVGISFFTFQALSYTIDVALGKLKPTHSVVDFFVFISFFPQLVAGPIERATNLLPQFQKPRRFDPDDAMHGICLLLYGLFKKMVVADTLSLYVDKVFENPALYDSLTCIIGACFFAIQIYCDFSGYSDSARGIAKLFGFSLMLNFDRPYLSQSITDFWRRWHISLSTWFKDYLYIPLGGNRVGPWKMLRNIWVVFLVSGLWHGAAWTFVAWGALHAFYQTVHWLKVRFFGKFPERGWMVPVNLFLVNVCVVFAWIFFRAKSFADVREYLGVIAEGRFASSLMALCAGIGPMAFAFCVMAIGLLGLSYLTPRDCRFKTRWAQWLFCAATVLAIVYLGRPAGGEFIYFQF